VKILRDVFKAYVELNKMILLDGWSIEFRYFFSLNKSSCFVSVSSYKYDGFDFFLNLNIVETS